MCGDFRFSRNFYQKFFLRFFEVIIPQISHIPLLKRWDTPDALEGVGINKGVGKSITCLLFINFKNYYKDGIKTYGSY